MSTLLTAVLTHHLGWVSTCLPNSEESHSNGTYNFLWGQLANLYGSVGHPTKRAQTIITGNSCHNDLIAKILNCLAYFIRCTDIVRYNIKRLHVSDDDAECERICVKNKCVSTVDENNYEDFVKEIMNDEKKEPQSFRRCKKNLLTRTKKFDSISEVCSSTFDENHCKEVESKVIFVLGDNDELVGLNKDKPPTRPTFLNVNKSTIELKSETELKASTSWTALDTLEMKEEKTFTRCRSEPPEDYRKVKNKYSGQMKFKLQQYPQILKNYMKSKNLELANLSIGGEDKLDFSELNSLRLDFGDCEGVSEDVLEPLQTPSNASELLEFTSDLFVDLPKVQNAKESSVESSTSTFLKQTLPNTIIKQTKETECNSMHVQRMRVVNFPMPRTELEKETVQFIPYTSTVIKGLGESYVPDVVLQGTTASKSEWDYKLKSDLSLNSQHSLLDSEIEEAVAIVANVDNW